MTRIKPRQISVSKLEVDNGRMMFRQPVTMDCILRLTRPLLVIAGVMPAILRRHLVEIWSRKYEAN